MKKYNRQTKGYKIDIYVDDVYFGSTDWYKTCKEAKERFLAVRPNYKADQVVCLFDKT